MELGRLERQAPACRGKLGAVQALRNRVAEAQVGFAYEPAAIFTLSADVDLDAVDARAGGALARSRALVHGVADDRVVLACLDHLAVSGLFDDDDGQCGARDDGHWRGR